MTTRGEPLGNRNNKATEEITSHDRQTLPTASYVLSSVGAIRFARGEPRRMTGRRSLDQLKIGRQSKSRFSDGCSIRVAFERLEIPPARANSSPSVDALAGTNRFKLTARCSVWSGLAVRNSHQTHQRLPPPVESLTTRVSGTSRRNVLGAIAQAKNDRNFPQRRQPN